MLNRGFRFGCNGKPACRSVTVAQVEYHCTFRKVEVPGLFARRIPHCNTLLVLLEVLVDGTNTNDVTCVPSVSNVVKLL